MVSILADCVSKQGRCIYTCCFSKQGKCGNTLLFCIGKRGRLHELLKKFTPSARCCSQKLVEALPQTPDEF